MLTPRETLARAAAAQKSRAASSSSGEASTTHHYSSGSSSPQRDRSPMSTTHQYSSGSSSPQRDRSPTMVRALRVLRERDGRSESRTQGDIQSSGSSSPQRDRSPMSTTHHYSSGSSSPQRDRSPMGESMVRAIRAFRDVRSESRTRERKRGDIRSIEVPEATVAPSSSSKFAAKRSSSILREREISVAAAPSPSSSKFVGTRASSTTRSTIQTSPSSKFSGRRASSTNTLRVQTTAVSADVSADVVDIVPSPTTKNSARSSPLKPRINIQTPISSLLIVNRDKSPLSGISSRIIASPRKTLRAFTPSRGKREVVEQLKQQQKLQQQQQQQTRGLTSPFKQRTATPSRKNRITPGENDVIQPDAHVNTLKDKKPPLLKLEMRAAMKDKSCERGENDHRYVLPENVSLQQDSFGTDNESNHEQDETFSSLQKEIIVTGPKRQGSVRKIVAGSTKGTPSMRVVEGKQVKEKNSLEAMRGGLQAIKERSASRGSGISSVPQSKQDTSQNREKPARRFSGRGVSSKDSLSIVNDGSIHEQGDISSSLQKESNGTGPKGQGNFHKILAGDGKDSSSLPFGGGKHVKDKNTLDAMREMHAIKDKNASREIASVPQTNQDTAQSREKPARRWSERGAVSDLHEASSAASDENTAGVREQQPEEPTKKEQKHQRSKKHPPSRSSSGGKFLKEKNPLELMRELQAMKESRIGSQENSIVPTEQQPQQGDPLQTLEKLGRRYSERGGDPTYLHQVSASSSSEEDKVGGSESFGSENETSTGEVVQSTLMNAIGPAREHEVPQNQNDLRGQKPIDILRKLQTKRDRRKEAKDYEPDQARFGSPSRSQETSTTDPGLSPPAPQLLLVDKRSKSSLWSRYSTSSNPSKKKENDFKKKSPSIIQASDEEEKSSHEVDVRSPSKQRTRNDEDKEPRSFLLLNDLDDASEASVLSKKLSKEKQRNSGDLTSEEKGGAPESTIRLGGMQFSDDDLLLLAQEVTESEQRAKSAEQQLLAMTQKHGDSQVELKRLAQEAADAQEKTKIAEDRLSLLNQKFNLFFKKHEENLDKVASLQKQLSCTNKDQDKSALNRTLLVKKLDEVRQQNEKHRAQVSTLKRELAEMHDKAKKLQEKLAAVRSESEMAAEMKQAEVEEKVKVANLQMEVMVMEEYRLKRKVDALTEELASAQSNLKHEQSNSRRLTGMLDAMAAEQRKDKGYLEGQKFLIRDLSAKLDSIRGEYSSELSTLRSAAKQDKGSVLSVRLEYLNELNDVQAAAKKDKENIIRRFRAFCSNVTVLGGSVFVCLLVPKWSPTWSVPDMLWYPTVFGCANLIFACLVAQYHDHSSRFDEKDVSSSKLCPTPRSETLSGKYSWPSPRSTENKDKSFSLAAVNPPEQGTRAKTFEKPASFLEEIPQPSPTFPPQHIEVGPKPSNMIVGNDQQNITKAAYSTPEPWNMSVKGKEQHSKAVYSFPQHIEVCPEPSNMIAGNEEQNVTEAAYSTPEPWNMCADGEEQKSMTSFAQAANSSPEPPSNVTASKEQHNVASCIEKECPSNVSISKEQHSVTSCIEKTYSNFEIIVEEDDEFREEDDMQPIIRDGTEAVQCHDRDSQFLGLGMQLQMNASSNVSSCDSDSEADYGMCRVVSSLSSSDCQDTELWRCTSVEEIEQNAPRFGSMNSITKPRKDVKSDFSRGDSKANKGDQRNSTSVFQQNWCVPSVSSDHPPGKLGLKNHQVKTRRPEMDEHNQHQSWNPNSSDHSRQTRKVNERVKEAMSSEEEREKNDQANKGDQRNSTSVFQKNWYVPSVSSDHPPDKLGLNHGHSQVETRRPERDERNQYQSWNPNSSDHSRQTREDNERVKEAMSSEEKREKNDQANKGDQRNSTSVFQQNWSVLSGSSDHPPDKLRLNHGHSQVETRRPERDEGNQYQSNNPNSSDHSSQTREDNERVKEAMSSEEKREKNNQAKLVSTTSNLKEEDKDETPKEQGLNMAASSEGVKTMAPETKNKDDNSKQQKSAKLDLVTLNRRSCSAERAKNLALVMERLSYAKAQRDDDQKVLKASVEKVNLIALRIEREPQFEANEEQKKEADNYQEEEGYSHEKAGHAQENEEEDFGPDRDKWNEYQEELFAHEVADDLFQETDDHERVGFNQELHEKAGHAQEKEEEDFGPDQDKWNEYQEEVFAHEVADDLFQEADDHERADFNQELVHDSNNEVGDEQEEDEDNNNTNHVEEEREDDNLEGEEEDDLNEADKRNNENQEKDDEEDDNLKKEADEEDKDDDEEDDNLKDDDDEEGGEKQLKDADKDDEQGKEQKQSFCLNQEILLSNNFQKSSSSDQLGMTEQYETEEEHNGTKPEEPHAWDPQVSNGYRQFDSPCSMFYMEPQGTEAPCDSESEEEMEPQCAEATHSCNIVMNASDSATEVCLSNNSEKSSNSDELEMMKQHETEEEEEHHCYTPGKSQAWDPQVSIGQSSEESQAWDPQVSIGQSSEESHKWQPQGAEAELDSESEEMMQTLVVYEEDQEDSNNIVMEVDSHNIVMDASDSSTEVLLSNIYQNSSSSDQLETMEQHEVEEEFHEVEEEHNGCMSGEVGEEQAVHDSGSEEMLEIIVVTEAEQEDFYNIVMDTSDCATEVLLSPCSSRMSRTPSMRMTPTMSMLSLSSKQPPSSKSTHPYFFNTTPKFASIRANNTFHT